MIQINAIENRISQKFTLRIPSTKSQRKNTVRIMLNTPISGRIPNLLITTYTAARIKKIPQNTLLLFMMQPLFF